MRILVADDDPTGRAVAHLLVAGAGHEVETVDEGGAALAALLSGGFDAALLDLHMPGMGGVAVATAVAAALPPAVRPRLIALTAAGPGAVAEPCFDACLSKPLQPPALAAALAGDPGLPREAAHPPAPQLADLCARLAEALARGDAEEIGALVRAIGALGGKE